MGSTLTGTTYSVWLELTVTKGSLTRASTDAPVTVKNVDRCFSYNLETVEIAVQIPEPGTMGDFTLLCVVVSTVEDYALQG